MSPYASKRPGYRCLFAVVKLHSAHNQLTIDCIGHNMLFVSTTNIDEYLNIACNGHLPDSSCAIVLARSLE